MVLYCHSKAMGSAAACCPVALQPCTRPIPYQFQNDIPLLNDRKYLSQVKFAIVAGVYLHDRTVRDNSSSKVLLYLANFRLSRTLSRYITCFLVGGGGVMRSR